MKILGIETSCDETALAVIDAKESYKNPSFEVLSNLVLSQVKMHEEYGGVFPNLAKREHARNLIPLFEKVLNEAGMLTLQLAPEKPEGANSKKLEVLEKLLIKEPELFAACKEFLPTIEKPDIDAIGVTYGPGLEPALWVGLNFAKALSIFWDIPFIPINHMEGHICSVLFNSKEKVEFPALALLISGGHTELVLSSDWTSYEIIGATRDDAVGEAFDKVARMLGLPYPGGAHLSKLAEHNRGTSNEGDSKSGDKNPFTFPRPMIHSPDFDFSFAGLKTSVLYTLKKIPNVSYGIKAQIAEAFEDAVVEVIISKTKKAIQKFNPKTVIVGGGVIANTRIREALQTLSLESKTKILIPDHKLTGDNALMIAIATYVRAEKFPELLSINALESHRASRVNGNLKLNKI